jgi:hypothetical protein
VQRNLHSISTCLPVKEKGSRACFAANVAESEKRKCLGLPSHYGSAIEWDGGEKFYDYRSWLCYIIEHFLKRWGYGAERHGRMAGRGS